MMAKAAASPILQLIHRVVEDPLVQDLPDQNLLQRFHSQHDEAAFHTLLRRHGPMVLDVCRGILGDGPNAEDAFQATFLVLAQKAGSIRKKASLGSWLHGVAYRTALKARAKPAVQQKHEARAPQRQPSEADDLSWREVRQVLHEELGGIPQRYREPLVVCYLEGATQQRAAARLGLAERTLRDRLKRGRELLRVRLVRRGLGPAAMLAVAAWPAVAVAAGVRAVLVDSTVKAAASVAAGAAASAVSAEVAALTQGVLRTMFLRNLKVTVVGVLVPALLLVAGVLIPGLCALPQTSLAEQAAVNQQEPPAPALPDARAPAPKSQTKGSDKILFYRVGRLTLIDPDGKNAKPVSAEGEKSYPLAARLSPDGKNLAIFQIREAAMAQVGTDIVRTPKVSLKLIVQGTDEKGSGTDLGVSCRTCAWSPDGVQIAYTEVLVDGTGKPLAKGRHWVENVKTREKSLLKFPGAHTLLDWSRDGALFLTTDLNFAAAPGKLPTGRLFLMNRDGTQRKVLTREEPGGLGGPFARLSPDGKRVLYVRTIPPRDDNAKPMPELVVLDIENGKASRVADTPLKAFVLGICWSPDGKRIAYTWQERHEGNPDDLIGKETESQLVVCNPDGKNRKTIVTEKARGQWITTLGQVDWR
jgi:RNA polymerase sigma factor (sigma-70 family)